MNKYNVHSAYATVTLLIEVSSIGKQYMQCITGIRTFVITNSQTCMIISISHTRGPHTPVVIPLTHASSSPVCCYSHSEQACGGAGKCSDAHGLDTAAAESVWWGGCSLEMEDIYTKQCDCLSLCISAHLIREVFGVR